jgi:hypothetical protein
MMRFHEVLLYTVSIGPSLMCVAGFVPQFVQVFQLRTAKMLASVFLWMDGLGGVFGLIGIAFALFRRPGAFASV